MALACGHFRQADARTKADLLAERVCPVCPDEVLAEGESLGGTVELWHCSCCEETWTLVDGEVRFWMGPFLHVL